MTGTYARRVPGNTVDITNLAVIIEPTSTKQLALAKALKLAICSNASVTLLSFDGPKSRELRLAKDSPGRIQLPHFASLNDWLGNFAIPLRARGIDVVTQVVTGDPAHDSLLNWLQQSDVDFVLKDIHRHTFAKQAFLTDADWRLVRFCPMPMLLSKPRPWQDSPAVVAAVDPLHASDPNAVLDHEIMAYATHLAERLNATLHAFHALGPDSGAVTAVTGAPLPNDDVVQAHAVEEQRRRWAMKAFIRRYALAKDRLYVTIGLPEADIPRIAIEHNADIVVMGALARNSATHMDVGSTAATVIESLPCDVLVIKSPLAS
jgi:universal stress protein E